MNKLRLPIKILLTLLLSCLLTGGWFASPFSERYWTWLNNLLGGQQPGLASDIELITTLLVSSVFSTLLVFSLIRKRH